MRRKQGSTYVGRCLPDPIQSLQKKPAFRHRSVPPLSLSRFALGSLPTGAESLLHVRLLFLEHGSSRFSSQQYSPARGRWPAALSVTHAPLGKGAGLWNSDDPGSARAGTLAAFIISGIWMVHPVHSAAIDYISGRAD